MKLRPGQKLAITNTLAHFKKQRRSLTVLPTGYGKTVVIAEVAHKQVTASRKKAIVVAPYMGLANQLRKELAKLTLLQVIVHHSDCQGHEYVEEADVIVTLPESLNNIVEDLKGDVCMVAFDESHHAVAETWYNAFLDLHDEGVNLMGVTATPLRTDNIKLSRLFDAVAVNYYLTQGVEEGYLVQPELRLHQLSGDHNKFGEMLNHCLHYAKEGKTLVFCDEIKKAEEYCAATNEAGKGEIAKVIHCRLPKREVKETLEAFENDDQIRVLFNVDMLREGYDNNKIRVVALLRKVKSDLVFTQMIGRCTRPWSPPQAESAEARLAEIANSPKPGAYIVDFHNREYTVAEHPISRILAPYHPKNLGNGITERVWETRKTSDWWKECRETTLGSFRSHNVLTGEVEDEGFYELLGINELADRLWDGSLDNVDKYVEKIVLARGERIRKTMKRLRTEGMTAKDALVSVLEEFGEEEFNEAVLFSQGLV
jgi:superfamily II DNA or RNA helicase